MHDSLSLMIKPGISRPHRGIVLLVVLGVLALLSVLAITFVRLTQLERSISKNYVDRTRATMIAESGIEAAIGRIQGWSGVLSAEQMASMVFNPDDPFTPLERAEKPSFPTPVLAPAGIQGMASGFVGEGTYVNNGDLFKLKVADESGKLNLNDVDNPMDPADPSSGRLYHLLANLGNIVCGSDQGDLIAFEITKARQEAGGRFSTRTEVTEALVKAGISDAAEQDRFLHNVTLWSWTDPNTLKPRPAFNKTDGVDGSGFQQNPDVFNYPATEAQLSGGGSLEDQLDDTYGDDIYMNSQFQHKGLELEPRSPVNINTASRELIQALLMGIQGSYVYEYGHERIVRSILAYSANRNTYAQNAIMNYPLLYGREPISPMHTEDRDAAPATVNKWYFACPPGFGMLFPDPDERRFITKVACPGWLDPWIWGKFHGPDANYLGHGFGSVRLTVEIDENLAENLSTAIYERIHTDKKPFGSWQEFQRFTRENENFNYYGNYHCDTVDYERRLTGNIVDYWCMEFMDDDGCRDLVRGDLYKKFQADAIIANFCPNSDLNDFNPNATLWRFTDKNDLLYYTTEFCFEPTGVFFIASEGYVLGKSANLLARQKITALVKVFETARITTQAQFFPEISTTMIDNQAEYFGNNQSSIQTAGMNSSITCSSWENGPLTQSYPEPLIAGEEERIRRAHYDGYVCLAANQSEVANGFRASFNGTLDADEAEGSSELMPDPEEQPTEDSLLFTPKEFEDYFSTKSSELRPGNLFADGGYSEAYRTLMYHSIDNFGGNTGKQGSLMFWVKPNWLPERSTRPRKFFSMANMNDRIASPCIGPPNLIRETSEFLLFYVPQQHYGMEYYPGMELENTAFISGHFPSNSRDFCFGWGGGGISASSQFNTIITNITNTVDFPDLDVDKDGKLDDRPYPNYNFNGHRWNFFAMSWLTTTTGSVFLRINQDVEPENHKYKHTGLTNYNGPGNWYNTYPIDDGIIYTLSGNETAEITPIGAENPMRFGEYVRGIPNYAADATFDEILCSPEDLSFESQIYYEDGRYYNNPINTETATYTTGILNSKTLGALSGTKSFSSSGAIPRSISWTIWWPDTYLMPDNPDPKSATVDPMAGILRDRNPDAIPSGDMNPNDETDAYYPDRPDPLWADVLVNDGDNGPGETWATDDNIKYDWDPITVDIELPDGSWLFANDPSYPNAAQGETGISYAGGTKLTRLDGSPIRLEGDDGIRFRFFFNEKQDTDKPLHETPVLDDITITYVTGKPTILRWQMIVD
ncbi:hypothetical protein ACFL54_02325 [Planctomycetota bacterium]